MSFENHKTRRMKETTMSKRYEFFRKFHASFYAPDDNVPEIIVVPFASDGGAGLPRVYEAKWDTINDTLDGDLGHRIAYGDAFKKGNKGVQREGCYVDNGALRRVSADDIYADIRKRYTLIAYQDAACDIHIVTKLTAEERSAFGKYARNAIYDITED